MTLQQQTNLVNYGKMIEVKVTPCIVNGELGVNYRDFQTTNADTANRDMLTFTLELYHRKECVA